MYSKTETLVLQAIKLADQVAARDYEGTPHAVAEGTRFLLGFQSIRIAADVITRGVGRRKAGERNLYGALQKLVARGLVERSDTRGMGGGFTLYQRTEKNA